MEFLEQVVALVVTLGLLVTFHEYGHFWVARKCGVKVLRFSVGFGKPIYSWRDKHNTEFAIAAIPLGGYVKMLDEREGPVDESELHLAFNRKNVWQRIAVVAAGPIANFIFAFIAYWMVAVIGVNSVAPIVGSIDEKSVAEVAGLKAGDEILSVAGETTPSWQGVVMSLAGFIGDTGEIPLEVINKDDSYPREISLSVTDWLGDADQPHLIESLGIHPFRPEIKPVIGQITPEMPAEKAGLLAEDEVIAINGEAIERWQDLVSVVQSHPEQPLIFGLNREGRALSLTIVPKAHTKENGEVIGLIGAAVKPAKWPDEYIRTSQKGVFEAIPAGLEKTWSVIKLTLGAVKKILFGDISLKTLSGPITIAQIAEESVSSGVETFLHFLAYLSVSLGVLNLLPIPVLDGGHLVYYFAEVIRGKPLPEKVQILGLKIGVALIMFLMVIAFYNDLARIF